MAIGRISPRDRVEPEGDPFPEIDGTSAVIRRLKARLRLAAADPDITVLILGESGSGKERVARAIHRASPRAPAPFVVVNCAGLSATLIEDELFGHVRGAFTGAVGDRPGPFERAAGGTVFLDEVGDLAPELQMKLLRALQERTIQRLGARQETAVDVRVVAATNVDLARAVEARRFREDLYYRLKVYDVVVPPLRRRGAADIRALAIAIVRRLADRRRRPAPAIDPDVIDRLVRHPWPGNVRELENTLECMVVESAGDVVLRARHLPESFDDGLSAAGGGRELPPIAEIVSTLERHEWKTVRTAKALGISRHQLYRLLARHGIRRPVGPG